MASLRSEIKYLALIVAVFGLVLILFPPGRDFALVDDWIYADVTGAMADGRGFYIHDWSQATLVSHAAWGWLFITIFGPGYTTLTWATLTLSLVALLVFYLLLRELGFAPSTALLGTAVLGFNPIFVQGGYSYMTDNTFLAMLLLSSLFYVRGLVGTQLIGSSGRDRSRPYTMSFLLLGSLFASLAFLTRQFGLLLPLAAMIWLLWARRLDWRRGLAVTALPLLTAAAYFGWASGYPPTSAGRYQQAMLADWLTDPAGAIIPRMLTLLFYLPIFAFCLPLWVGLQRRYWLLPLWLLPVLVVYYQVSQQTGGQLTINGNPGTLLDGVVRLLGVLPAAFLLAGISSRLWGWFRSLPHRQQSPPPVAFLYLAAAMLFVGTLVVGRLFFSRYLLPLLPMLIVLALVGVRGWPLRRLAVIGLVMVLIGGYSLAQHADFYAYNAATWSAGRDLVAQAVPLDHIDGGFAWNGQHLYDEALRRTGGRLPAPPGSFAPDYIIDPQFRVRITPQEGYRIVRRYPFFSILNGLADREVLVLQRR